MIIRVQELVFSYRDFSLHVGSLDFESARISSIVGPNGAGKTTLLKCLGGVLPVAKSSLFVNGQDIAKLKSRERARLISYVPQEHGSIFDYSVLDFILMGRAAYLSPFSLPSEADTAMALGALEFVGLESYAERTYTQLSSGERRLVLIARALAQGTPVLLLDEPTTFLDPKHEKEILELVRKLAVEKEKTILITLHNLEMAIQYSDALVFMKGGGIFASGKTAEILTDELLESVYDLRMKIVDYEGRKLIVK